MNEVITAVSQAIGVTLLAMLFIAIPLLFGLSIGFGWYAGLILILGAITLAEFVLILTVLCLKMKEE